MKNFNRQETANTKKVIECPICLNQDQIAKVSAVYKRGVSETSSSGRAIGVSAPISLNESPYISYMPISMSGMNISKLSKKLAPPSYPKKKSFGCFKLFIIFIGSIFTIGLGLLAGMGVAMSETPGIATEPRLSKGLGIFLIIILFFCFVLTWVLIGFLFKRRQNKIDIEFQSTLKLYNSHYSRWNKLYYCFRDDIVFDPETNEYAPADKISNLIYKDFLVR
jgi:hypothetical protein